MANLYYPPTTNGLQKQLDADFDTGETTTMTLTNTTGVQNKPGVVVINRIDTNGDELATASREYVTFTGVSGSTLTGLVRGLGGTSDQDHVTGAVVEFLPDITVFQGINDVITAEHGTDGTHGDITPTSVVTPSLSIGSTNINTGWFEATGTWTYSAWDDTNGVSTASITVPSDATTVYQPGMRVMFDQTTDGTKYGIITKVAATELTIFLNTDYDFDNETISNVFYSPMSTPFGFDRDVNKYTVEYTNASNEIEASPTANTWYNSNSASIDVPIGLWNVSYKVVAQDFTSTTVSTVGVLTTLSTANNSESDDGWTLKSLSNGGSVANRNIMSPHFMISEINLSAKSTRYLNTSTPQSSHTHVGNLGSDAETIIRATCAYL